MRCLPVACIRRLRRVAYSHAARKANRRGASLRPLRAPLAPKAGEATAALPEVPRAVRVGKATQYMTTIFPTRAEIEATVSEYVAITEAMNISRRRQQRLREQIVQFMELEGETEITEGESGVTVQLNTRTAAPTYDVRSMPEALVLQLHGLAALDVSRKVIQAQEDRIIESLDVKRFELPGRESVALTVMQDGDV